MEKSFLEYYDFYEGVCKERLHLQGQNMQVVLIFFFKKSAHLVLLCISHSAASVISLMLR